MENAWKKYAGNLDPVMNFGKDYIDFMTLSKTERETVDNSIEIAEKAGFKDLNTVSELKAGDKVYFNNRGKSLFLFVVGKEDLAKGLNILGAHVDSPRLDLKQHPLYEDSGLVLLDTHYYGGIKKYQWVAQPLALHGVVCKKDGSLVKVVIGESEDDPVVGVSDLLIHLAADQMKKTGSNVVEGEDLNVLFGSIPAATEEDEKELVKKNILNLLKEKYDIEEDDFISAEIEVVPAGKARDYGFDRSMVMAYGQDDNVCAYTSLRAIVEEENPERTSCCILSDKEEVGSQGNTGMHSSAFENTLAELMDKCGQYSELNIRRCLRNSMMLSSDVSAAHDPNYPSVSSPNQNNAEFGKGIVFNKYTGSRGKGGSNDANPEFIAKIRKVLDENGVNYQTSELGKVDQGGGGTIAYILANKDVEVIDAGVAVQNMHACYEVTSKVDIYEAYLAYKAFLKDMK
ncbi:MAG: aminopeptidase [Erysipelotrichaceae bacterium]|nr:aminopeptidase [Solobacterium sp.]MDY2952881.1 aminopeptidase [Erysipelotrichaceae bacterium]MCI6697288.1 aminopeptidase [Solobacterium sp.]MCI6845595.1 aminopeptidase [Solobacterium sp.]MCI7445772.1 aminopeptidase [Solobacterium sp.]